MRHPAAPTIIAVLLGFLAFMILWSRLRGDPHHEGNPHPNDVPRPIPGRTERKDDIEVENEDESGDGTGDEDDSEELEQK